jgi:hypothetical protein
VVVVVGVVAGFAPPADVVVDVVDVGGEPSGGAVVGGVLEGWLVALGRAAAAEIGLFTR